jgi:hypothetical protein
LDGCGLAHDVLDWTNGSDIGRRLFRMELRRRLRARCEEIAKAGNQRQVATQLQYGRWVLTDAERESLGAWRDLAERFGNWEDGLSALQPVSHERRFRARFQAFGA